MSIEKIGSNMYLHLRKNVTVLYSYNTPVAAYVRSIGYVRTSQYYSKTTSKHINKWLHGQDYEVVSQEHIDFLAKD